MKKKKRGFQSRSRAEKHALRAGKHKDKKNKNKPHHPSPTGGDRTYTGRVQKNPRGFAFVIPNNEAIPDVFFNPEEAAGLVDGDIIEFFVRRQGQRVSGKLKEVKHRSRTKVLGQLTKERKGWILRSRENDWYEVKQERRQTLTEGWAVGDIEKYASLTQTGLVRLTDYLGPKLLPRHDNLLAIVQHGLPDEFPQEVIGEAFQSRRIPIVPDGRKDHRDLPFVTIDGEDAKDFDDAICVQKASGQTAYILYVAIADVSFYVRERTALDDEARKRGTSVYFPNFVIPMLPEQLSNDLCSLRPKQERYALTAEIHYDRNGEVVETAFYESLIQTHARLTYTMVHDYQEGKEETRKELAFLKEPLENAFQLFKLLTKQRKSRGVLDFSLPESKIELDQAGVPIRTFQAPRYDSHKLIEEFMIAANRAVAKALRESEVPAVYRVHESPKEESLIEINQMLRGFGINFEMKDLSPISFAEVLEKTTPLKQAGIVHQFVLRTQKQARYLPDPLGHFGLALEDYTHFTSPIRRYPDLVVHRALKRLIYDDRSADKEGKDPYQLEAIAEETSERERKAMEAERFVVRRKQCWFMQNHLGKSFKGRISGVIARGLFVEIPEFAIDGFVPIEELKGYYSFDEAKHCLKQKPGNKVLTIGDSFDIVVARVSMEDHQITFAPA